MGMKLSLIPKVSTENGTETLSRSCKDSILSPSFTSSSSWHEFSDCALGNKSGPLESNAHSPLFTSLYALHPRYLTLTSWFLINTVLERMPLLCNRFLSQKSHIFPWDFLSRYFNGKYVKLHHNKYAPPCTGSI